MNISIGYYKNYERSFTNISYNCPTLRIYGYSSEKALNTAINKQIRLNNKIGQMAK